MNAEEIVKIAKRDNNAKRPFLLVNPLQGKHIPVSPQKTMALFAELAKKIYQQHDGERLLLIGFAETATAIGAAVAVLAPYDLFYIHTTREQNDKWDCLFFSETHSHATEQKLIINRLEEQLKKADRIVFIEDEVTTGNTIRNTIHVLRQKWPEISMQFGIASIVNGMTDEGLQTFAQDAIPVTYLHRIVPQDYAKLLAKYHYEPTATLTPVDFPSTNTGILLRKNAEPRIGVWSSWYFSQCKKMADTILSHLENEDIANEKILVLGAEEFMFAPLLLAYELEKKYQNAKIWFHAGTRSPILPSKDKGYPLYSRYRLASLYDKNRATFIYNLERYDRVLLIHDAYQGEEAGISDLQAALLANGCQKLHIYRWQDSMQSSYRDEDVTVLLKDITGLVTPLPTEEREKRIQSGAHYSTMLPLEYQPSQKYEEAYEIALRDYAKSTADAVCQLGELLYQQKGSHLTLVSLARAGIPIGILLKRYLQQKYHFNPPHYAISIIRGQGIDQNAMTYLLQNHSPESIQFVDGWIGKGAILRQLAEALKPYPTVNPDLAALCDPANLTDLCGTHEDILIPSSCLNSTISGLLSRTFLRNDIIGKYDFHGACCYQEFKGKDVSYPFIDAIAAQFKHNAVPKILPKGQPGMQEVMDISQHFGIEDIHLIKPGIGEATRVLLRRVPWKLLIWEDGFNDPRLSHLLRLADEKKVAVESYPLKNYKACGIIKTMADT